MPSFFALLEKSLAKNPGLEAKFISLATLNLNASFPSCRTVVYRGLKRDSIVIYTDKESTKYQELKKNENVEICWYFRESREQYRIRGSARIYDGVDETETELEEYREDCWSRMSQSAKELYLQVIGFLPNAEPVQACQWNQEKDLLAKKRFVLLLITPSQVEYLDLCEKNAIPVKL